MTTEMLTPRQADAMELLLLLGPLDRGRVTSAITGTVQHAVADSLYVAGLVDFLTDETVALTDTGLAAAYRIDGALHRA